MSYSQIWLPSIVHPVQSTELETPAASAHVFSFASDSQQATAPSLMVPKVMALLCPSHGVGEGGDVTDAVGVAVARVGLGVGAAVGSETQGAIIM